MTKITEHEERIKDLEMNAIRLTKEVTEFHKLLDKESIPTKEFREDVKKLEKTKAEITSYTLQLITIIVGIFALILTISYFAVNKSIFNDLSWLIILNVIFVFVLITWFILWFVKENPLNLKLFKK